MGKEVKSVSDAGAEFIHFDVMDGHFVPNIFFAPAIIRPLKKFSNAMFDVHLMVTNPTVHVELLASSGADIITFHIESKSDTKKTIDLIKEKGKKPGIVINPKTPPEKIINYLNEVYMVVVMGVEPGFSGQQFISDTTEKVSKIKKLIKNSGHNVLIEVDGGVNAGVAKELEDAGADICVSGSFIFLSKDRKKAIDSLKFF
jgi:ribulose-phosphate 3-epimerase